MATFDLTARINVVNPSANLDSQYGPYETTDAAVTALGPLLTSAAVGRTVGIIENGQVVEYWWQNTGVDENNEATYGFVIKHESQEIETIKEQDISDLFDE